MARDGRSFDPQPVLADGVAGMRAVLNHVFPETVKADDGLKGEIERLIEQLGDDSFAQREAATARLREIGATHQGALHKAMASADPEAATITMKIRDNVLRAQVPGSRA